MGQLLLNVERGKLEMRVCMSYKDIEVVPGLQGQLGQGHVWGEYV